MMSRRHGSVLNVHMPMIRWHTASSAVIVFKMKPMKMQENDAHQLQSEKENLENLTARLFSLAESDENR